MYVQSCVEGTDVSSVFFDFDLDILFPYGVDERYVFTRFLWVFWWKIYQYIRMVKAKSVVIYYDYNG